MFYSLSGIERLVEEEVFVAAYPLHVVSSIFRAARWLNHF
jgi:hypothetical protein